MLLRPGITLQHTREQAVGTDRVRGDITAFVGLIPFKRWPTGAVTGDFLEKRLLSWEDLASSPVLGFLDPITARSILLYFQNGGVEARLFALCAPSEESLLTPDPWADVAFALIDRLRNEDEIALIAMPVLAYLPVGYEPGGRPIVRCQPFIEMLVDHCREMNHRFLILDTPRDLHDEPLRVWVRELRESLGEASCFAAIYYPWLMNGDDVFPPSGAVAGVFARTDNEHQPYGVHWPPANQVLRGVTHPAVELRWREGDFLIDEHINPILTQPTRGVVVWGARTLSGDPRWIHINSRRITSLIAAQLRKDAEWLVFENQRPELWGMVTRIVSSRLDQMWQAGLLAGERAGSQYLVKCDAELNPQEVRDAGQINIQVQLRPVSTTEYIVVDLRLGD